MDRVLSARVDSSVLDEMDRVTKRLKITKKQFREEAIRNRAAAIDPPCVNQALLQAIDHAFGAWQRDETPEETIASLRAASEASWRRTWDTIDAQAGAERDT